MAQNLPEDLLCAIFLHTLPSVFVLTTADDSERNKPLMTSPLNFSLVCRSWRNLVLLQPTLWREMSIESAIEADKEYRDPKFVSVVKNWLRLSYSVPLRINIEVEGDRHGYVSDTILPLFAQESHRWEFASIRVDIGDEPPLNPSNITPLYSPYLSSLSLSFSGRNSTAFAHCFNRPCC